MSEPVSVVTTFLDALAAGDSRSALDLLDVDIEWRNTGLPTLRGRRATGALIGMEKRGVGFGYTMHAAAAEGDVVLTDLRDRSALLVFDERLDGIVSVRDSSGALVAEIFKATGEPVVYALGEGRYTLRLRARDNT
ncbi:MAG: limonene-1,2-epoxide hydrolase family protein, partial [Nocardioides sp.]